MTKQLHFHEISEAKNFILDREVRDRPIPDIYRAGANSANGDKHTMHVSSVIKSRPTLCDPHGLQLSRLLCPWDFPGKNTGVGSHFLLQGIFLIQGLNLGLVHYRQILYH